jgi:hypothetical protein
MASARVGTPDQVMPSVHGNLAGDDERALVVAIFDDFQKIARLSGGGRLRPPVIQDQQFDPGEGAHEPGVAVVAMRDREVGEEPRKSVLHKTI